MRERNPISDWESDDEQQHRDYRRKSQAQPKRLTHFVSSPRRRAKSETGRLMASVRMVLMYAHHCSESRFRKVSEGFEMSPEFDINDEVTQKVL
jgi:hypothetical protein